MYVKKSFPTEKTALLYQCSWLLDGERSYEELRITEGARILAPEGKCITFTVDGMGRELKPGHYVGQIHLSLSEGYDMAPHGLMNANAISRLLHTVVCVENGAVQAKKCSPALLNGGTISDRALEGAYIASTEPSLNGIVVAGEGEYLVKDVRMDLEGMGDNDFLGVGACVAAIDRAKVRIEDCSFTLNGVTRCAVHVGGDSEVTVKNCAIENISPDSDRLGFFSWQVGLLGTNRLVQLADNGHVTYEHCRLKTNGWGICSIDGSDEGVKMLLKDCEMVLDGPRAHGYGAFCIGENEVVLDHCRTNVNGYPLMLMGMQGLGRAAIRNGSVITGRRFGVFIVGDDNSVLTLEDSRFETGKSCLSLKGSATVIHMNNCEVQTGNGVLLQMTDTDEAGMTAMEYRIPVGETDTPIEGRDLSHAREKEDVFLHLTDMEVTGDIFNSTTNLRAYTRGAQGTPGAFHDMLIGPVHFFDAPPADMPAPPDHRGPKNLAVSLKNTHITGCISAAGQAYREGLTRITEENRLELSNVTQWAQKPVNNGVIVALDAKSTWTVTETAYLTALTVEEGAVLKAPAGKRLTLTVNGKNVPLAGHYEGDICLYVGEQ